MKFRLLIAVVVAVTLTAAGCSSDSDDAAEVSDTSATSNPVTTVASETTTTSATTTTVKNTTTSVVVDADRVTIETDSDFSSEPIHGTFEVTEGADILGCSNGTYLDTPPVNEFDPTVDEINKVMTCSEPDTGTFTIAFIPNGYDTGPGVLNGPWRILDGFDDFTDLHGEGDHWLVMDGPKSGVETYTGDIEYTF